MNAIPITRDDFIAIGARHTSADLIHAITRLVAIARPDIARLTERGYTASKLDALVALQAQLTAEGADARSVRTAKKSARRTELDAVREGKLLVRSGHAMVFNAIADRQPGRGETEDRSREIATELATALDAVSGRIGNDPIKLGDKLTALRALLGRTEIASHDRHVTAARTVFLAKVDAVLERLPALGAHKTQAQLASRQGTSDLDEVDGRAYFNMKQLTQAGRHYWLEHHDAARAAEYRLEVPHAGAHAQPTPPTPAPPTAPPTTTG